MGGGKVSSLQSPWQDCSIAASRGSALTPPDILPSVLPAPYWQKDALAAPEKTPGTNLSVSHPSMAGPALLGGRSVGGHQVQQGEGEE